PATGPAAAAGVAGTARGGDVLAHGVPECFGVLVGEVDLVVGPVQTEPDRLTLPVRNGLTVEVVSELNNRPLRHHQHLPTENSNTAPPRAYTSDFMLAVHRRRV